MATVDDDASAPSDQSRGDDEPTVIRADSVRKQYGETVAIEDVSFSVSRGETAAFLGPNGSGKTTLIRLLNGVLTPSSGDISVFGHALEDGPLPVQRRSGVVTESLSLYERFSGRYNLRFYGRLYGVDPETAASRIQRLSEILSLESYIDDPVETYSTGMKKRLLLARSLLHDPDILFLDEPTNGLDPQAARTVVDHVDAIRRDRDVTVFLCTHNLQVAERLSTQIFFLDRGTIVAAGTPADLRTELWPEVTVTLTVGAWSDSLASELRDRSWVEAVDRTDDHSEIPETSVVRVELAGRETIPSLVDALGEGGARLYRLEEERYSFEDIYFRIREELR